MQVSLCYTNSENNVIGKSISTIANVTAVIKSAISKENPILILAYNIVQNNINYVYIPEYGRYYYITDILDLTGGRYEIHCKVDVLESFKTSIKNLSCIIDKQEDINKGNVYFDDGSFKVTSKEFLQSYNFPNGFNDNGEFILITCGGD